MPVVLRSTAKMRPDRATSFLFGVRLTAPVLALVVVLGVCVPSYLILEPNKTTEQIGAPCLAAAAVGISIWVMSVSRSVNAYVATNRFVRACGEKLQRPAVMTTGIIKPRVVVSEDAMVVLSAKQLELVMRHENAHVLHRDNLKRLLLMLAPNMIPLVNSFRPLEQAWARCAEWAADDAASAGSEEDAASLAEALLRVASLPDNRPRHNAAFTSLFVSNQDLALRIDRLLSARAMPTHHGNRRMKSIGSIVTIAIISAICIVLADPPTLVVVHRSLELLMH